MTVSLLKNRWRLSAGKKAISLFTFFLRYCKNVVNVYFGHVWISTPKIKLSTFWNFCVHLQANTMLLGKYCEDMQTYFEYSGHGCLHTPKMKASTCRRPRCLNACQKWTSAFTFFLRYYLLKNPAIWFAGRILAHNSSIQKFVRYEIGRKISITILVFILDHFQRKAMSKFFKKCKKPYFGPFWPKFGQKWILFGKRALSVFKYSSWLPLCQVSEKTNG